MSNNAVKIRLASNPSAVQVCTVTNPTQQNNLDDRLLQMQIHNQQQVIQKLEEKLAAANNERRQLNAAVNNVVTELKQYKQEILSQAQVQLIDLSCDIAGKILCQEINQGNYDMKKIVSEAINHLPVKKEITVHVNPGDHAALIEGLQDNSTVKLIPDQNINPAECKVETPEGFVTNKLETTLKDIADTLKSL